MITYAKKDAAKSHGTCIQPKYLHRFFAWGFNMVGVSLDFKINKMEPEVQVTSKRCVNDQTFESGTGRI